jgi:bifunctional UDP-N-acetylglucosamine pyrophosphorylase/glucosamine-1-phosphate N-acetyltransferase
MTKPQVAAVVLAAGQGTRMKSDRPKVLHAIAGRPMIHYVLEALEALGPDVTVVVVSPGMDEVAEAVAPTPCVVQAKPRGTGDAVMAARDALEGFSGDVLVAFADSPFITRETLKRLLAARRQAPEPAVVVLGMRLEDPGEYGRLKVDAEGALQSIVEFRDASEDERASKLCNSGVMAVDGAVLFELLGELGTDNAKGEYYLTDIVRVARAQGLPCAAVEGGAGELAGVNSRADLAVAEAIVQERLRAAAMARGVTLIDPTTVYFSFDTALGRDVTIGPNVVFGPGVTVASGAEIRAFSHIEGATIGPGAIVGPFARVRPGTEIGAKARVGNFVEVKSAVIEAGAKVNHLSYIGDARVGAEANVGAGTITCNYDGFAKYETEIGPGAFIGSNAALVAPVTVGKGAVVGAGSVIVRDVPDDALAVARADQTNREGGAARLRERKGAAKPRRPRTAKKA